MKFLLGVKQHMTQLFDESGNVHPVTVIQAGPVGVVSVRTKEKDGYAAIQFGFGEKKPRAIKKALSGHMKGKTFAHLREYRMKEGETAPKENDHFDVSVFQKGDNVTVRGISKGKGFQGVVKRHGFHGGPRTHGQKHTERSPGSIGATGPQRVLKGTKMAGRMGSDMVTEKNLTIVEVDAKAGLLLVEGSVPGKHGTLLEIRG